jgi:lysophospholipid acyltransferase (LPLAT)-like uncharacterized protein
MILGWLLGIVARVWLATLRVRLEVHPSLLRADAAHRPWVLSFFHGTQWPLLAWKRRRKTAVMVSRSKDGAMQARALALLGFDVLRGSSSREGARGLAALVRKVRGNERDVAFAVDGPRGPYGVPKPGAAFVAERTGALLVPMGSAVGRGKVFTRAWDRFALAWPFTTVAVVLGCPVRAECSDSSERLGSAIEETNARAVALLGGPPSHMIPSERI